MDQASMKRIVANDGSKFNFQYNGTYWKLLWSLMEKTIEN
jgi:hypothetical protein